MSGLFWAGLIVIVVLLIVRGSLGASVPRLVRAAAKTEDLGPLIAALTKKRNTAQPTAFNQAIRQCQRGEPAGFELLAQLFGPRLYRYFLRLTGSPADADDLLQDMFVRLMQKMKTYRHQDRFERWLFTVAANLGRDHFRRAGRTAALSLDAPTDH